MTESEREENDETGQEQQFELDMIQTEENRDDEKEEKINGEIGRNRI